MGDRIQCLVCKSWFHRISYNHLAQHRMTTEGYRERYGVVHFASKSLRRKQSRPIKRGRRFIPYSVTELSQQIRKKAKKRAPLPVTTTWLAEEDPSLLNQILRLYPDFSTALKSAGIRKNATSMRNNWKDGKMVRAVKKWSKMHGPLNYKLMKVTAPQLCDALSWKYGNLKKAAGRLKLGYRNCHESWPRKRIISELRAFCKGKSKPGARQVFETNRKLYMAILRHMKSFQNGLKAAGIR